MLVIMNLNDVVTYAAIIYTEKPLIIQFWIWLKKDINLYSKDGILGRQKHPEFCLTVCFLFLSRNYLKIFFRSGRTIVLRDLVIFYSLCHPLNRCWYHP